MKYFACETHLGKIFGTQHDHAKRHEIKGAERETSLLFWVLWRFRLFRSCPPDQCIVLLESDSSLGQAQPAAAILSPKQGVGGQQF